MEKNLDFRSDTKTLPTAEMRRAMAEAQVGDDVDGEDPTVNRLEQRAAEILGMESGLFVTSGTMGNAVAILAHTARGDEIILEEGCHIYGNEVGGFAVFGGLMSHTVKGEKGWIKPEQIHKAVRSENIHYPQTTLLCLENTHNNAGGIPLTVSQMKASYNAAKEHALIVHLDGARIFNASVALDVDVKEITKYTDTVQFCLSKGLGAPIGSMVVGPSELIYKARKYRKMLGGGMRQAGVIAAPGLVALESMVNRLAEDHMNAKILGEGLLELGLKLAYPVKTNMVYVDLSASGWSAKKWVDACNKLGWKTKSDALLRLCTHYGMTTEDIELFLEGLDRYV